MAYSKLGFDCELCSLFGEGRIVVGGFEGELCKHVGFEGESCGNVFVCVSLVSNVSCVLVDMYMRCVWMLVFSVKLVFGIGFEC